MTQQDTDRVKQRCVNIDWLEVYVLESNDRFPCNADYYRRQGYLVKEREYGTRVYKEMFTIVDEDNNPLVEIRRNPASGDSNFLGLLDCSSHIRLPNWMLYQGNPIEFLRNFLLRNDYIFKRIYRIDICYDFEKFDSGDKPARFAKRYLEGVYRKINQCHMTAHGFDSWSGYDVETLSWGSQSSMVSTKLYNKTKELKAAKNDKPWIKTAWMLAGLIDNPSSMTKRDTNGNLYSPEIWRVEFSMKSEADGWLVIEKQGGKKVKKQAIPHRLEQFDAKDKLWARFQDLAFHYFHFKHVEYIGDSTVLEVKDGRLAHSDVELKPQRKDRCRDKTLFKWDEGHVFTQLSAAPPPSKRSNTDEILRRRLNEYRAHNPQAEIRQACDVILHHLERFDILRYAPLGDPIERQAMVLAIKAKIGGDERDALEIIAEIKALLEKDTIL